MKGTQTSFDGVNPVEVRHEDLDLSGQIVDNTVLKIKVLPSTPHAQVFIDNTEYPSNGINHLL